MRLSFATLFLGLVLIFQGGGNHGIALLMSWLGFSFFMTGLGYSGVLSANIYGKDECGQISMAYTLLHGPFLLYTWSIWRLIQLFTRENAYDQIGENIIIGRRLFENECPIGVVNYVDLTVEFNEPQLLVERSNYIFLPILDGSVPDIERLEKSFQQLIDGLTYIHCAQGHGRAGLFAALLLIRQGKVKNADEALALLKQFRPGLNLSREQIQFLQIYTV